MKTTRDLFQAQSTTPFDIVMHNLGLSVTNLAAIEGRVLDFGCGPEAAFTKALRAMGIEADGVDMHLETEAPYLMEAFIDQVGAVPQPDGTYELIVAHLVPGIYFNNQPLLEGLSLAGEDPAPLDSVAQASLQEVVRLLDPKKGKFIAYPGLIYAPESTLDALTRNGLTYDTVRVEHESAIGLLSIFHNMPPFFAEMITSRTTLRYK